MEGEYLDLRTLSKRCGLSTSTLRTLIHSPTDQLPAFRVHGKLLVDPKEFSRFMRRHRLRPACAESMHDVADQIMTEVIDGQSTET